MLTDFEDLTEQWGMPMPGPQVRMARTRYELARSYGSARDVLEVACGSGFGLEYLLPDVRRLVGGDLTMANLRHCRSHVPGAEVVRLDAHALPFASASFDAVIAFEALYYFAEPATVLAECHRVLRPGGHVVLSLPNAMHRGFHPSPHSVGYPTAPELGSLLESARLTPALFAAFPTGNDGWRARMVAAATGAASRMRLIPGDLKGRARLKRLAYGELAPFSGLLESGELEPLVPVGTGMALQTYRTLYAVGVRG